jgi:hypothetical protein
MEGDMITKEEYYYYRESIIGKPFWYWDNKTAQVGNKMSQMFSCSDCGYDKCGWPKKRCGCPYIILNFMYTIDDNMYSLFDYSPSKERDISVNLEKGIGKRS